MVSAIKSKINQVIPSLIIERLAEVKAIYLFGSHASGLSSKSSDIDIAVLLDKKLSPVDRWQIQSELTNELFCDVDLVDLLTASTVMQNQIIQHGIILYQTDNSADFFEVQVMSMYQHLNDERADILNDFIKG
jgi:predicted nucleotidyltransferase